MPDAPSPESIAAPAVTGVQIIAYFPSREVTVRCSCGHTEQHLVSDLIDWTSQRSQLVRAIEVGTPPQKVVITGAWICDFCLDTYVE